MYVYFVDPIISKGYCTVQYSTVHEVPTLLYRYVILNYYYCKDDFLYYSTSNLQCRTV